MPCLHVTRLAPYLPDGPDAARYLVYVDEALVDTLARDPRDDAAALDEIRQKHAAGASLGCALELAASGAPLGFTPEATPRAVLEHRAGEAMRSVDGRVRFIDGDALVEVARASVDFIAARPWEAWKNTERLATSVDATEIFGKLSLHPKLVVLGGEESDGPRVILEDEGEFSRATNPNRPPLPVDIEVHFTTEPAYVVEANEQAFGLPFHPRIVHRIGGAMHGGDALDALLLAAAMRGAVRRVAGDAKPIGRAKSEHGEVTLAIDLKKRSKVRGLAPAKTEAGNRERARGIVLALHAREIADDKPPMSDEVCVVADFADPLARELGAMYESARSNISREAAMAIVEREPRRAGSMVALWFPDHLLVQWLALYVPKEIMGYVAPFFGSARPVWSVRALLVQDGVVDPFDVDFNPNEMARLRGEFQVADRVREGVAKLQRSLEAARAAAPPDPQPMAPVEGTWRDPANYLPATLPAGWTLGEIDDNGARIVDLGDDLVAHVGAARRDGRRWVGAMFMRTGESDRAPSKDEVGALLSRLRDCGTFHEVTLAVDDEALEMPRALRVFTAPMLKRG